MVINSRQWSLERVHDELERRDARRMERRLERSRNARRFVAGRGARRRTLAVAAANSSRGLWP